MLSSRPTVVAAPGEEERGEVKRKGTEGSPELRGDGQSPSIVSACEHVDAPLTARQQEAAVTIAAKHDDIAANTQSCHSWPTVAADISEGGHSRPIVAANCSASSLSRPCEAADYSKRAGDVTRKPRYERPCAEVTLRCPYRYLPAALVPAEATTCDWPGSCYLFGQTCLWAGFDVVVFWIPSCKHGGVRLCLELV